MQNSKEIIEKTIAFGKAVLTAEDTEIEAPVLFTIEDDAYIYGYCPDFGLFAYGNDIDAAKDNLASAISVNLSKLHEESSLADIYSNPLEPKYMEAYETLRKMRNASLLAPVYERIVQPENTKIINEIKKEPQVYTISKTIQLKISVEKVKREQAA